MAYKGSTLLAGGIEYSVEENKDKFALADASQINVDLQSTSGLDERLDEVLKKLKGNVDSVTESSGNLSDRLDSIDSSISDLQTGLSQEQKERGNLSSKLDEEIAAREVTDKKLGEQTEARKATDAALNEEKTARQEKDTQQDDRLTQLESTVGGLGQGGTVNDAAIKALQEALAKEQQDRQNADTALQTAVDAAKDTADAASTAAGQAQNAATQANDKATALQEEIAAARTDIKGTQHDTLKQSIESSVKSVTAEAGGTTIVIEQKTGQSTEAVMSQKAVTDELGKLDSKITNLSIPPDLSGQVNDLDTRLDTAQGKITVLEQKVGDGGGGTVQGLTQSEVKDMLQNLRIGTAQYLRGVDSDQPFSQSGLSYDDQADTRQYGKFHVRGTLPTVMSTKDLTNSPPPPPNPNIKHIWKAVRGGAEEVRQYGIWVPYGTPLTLSAWIYTSAESRNDFYFLVTCAQKTNHISTSDNNGVTVTGGWQKVVRRFIADNTFGSGSLLTDTQSVNVAVGYKYQTGGDSSHRYDGDLYIAGLQLEYGDTIVSDFHDDEIVSAATSIPPAASSGMTIRYVTTEQYNQFQSFIPNKDEIVLCAVNDGLDIASGGGGILGYFIGDGMHTTQQLPYFLMPYYKDQKAYASAFGVPDSDAGMGTIQFALQGSSSSSGSGTGSSNSIYSLTLFPDAVTASIEQTDGVIAITGKGYVFPNVEEHYTIDAQILLPFSFSNQFTFTQATLPEYCKVISLNHTNIPHMSFGRGQDFFSFTYYDNDSSVQEHEMHVVFEGVTCNKSGNFYYVTIPKSSGGSSDNKVLAWSSTAGDSTTSASGSGQYLNYLVNGSVQFSLDFGDAFTIQNSGVYYSVYPKVDNSTIKVDSSGHLYAVNSGSSTSITPSSIPTGSQYSITACSGSSIYYNSAIKMANANDSHSVFAIFSNNSATLQVISFHTSGNAEFTGNIKAKSIDVSNTLSVGTGHTFDDISGLAVNYCGAIGEALFTHRYELACGIYNTNNQDSLLSIGIGTGPGTDGTYRRLGFRVSRTGRVYSYGTITPGADYAEYFEWEDGNLNNEDRVGHFVTINEDKISIATDTSDYILGVVSANPSCVGDAASEQWQGRFKKDIFGRQIKQYISKSDYYNEETDSYDSGTTIECSALNPDYDENQTYVPREQRPEWSPIGLMGKLIVIDDGTCEVNGYCKPNSAGIATKDESNNGYRVIKRLDETHVKIILK